MEVNIKRCARCGKNHSLSFDEFDKPIKIFSQSGDIEFTHWAMCPYKQEPIILKILIVEEMTDDDIGKKE